MSKAKDDVNVDTAKIGRYPSGAYEFWKDMRNIFFNDDLE